MRSPVPIRRESVGKGSVPLLIFAATVAMLAQVSTTLPPAAIPTEEAAQLASGWALMAEGKHDEAARFAAQVLSRYPRSIPALSLMIDADIARGGAATALGTYEAWLGTRTLEEPGVLRRVARACLYEWARLGTDTAARAEALKALVQEGDPEAVAVLTASAAGGNAADLRALATLGNAEAIDRIAGQLKSTSGLKLREIMTLGESRNPRAAAALVGVLSDARPENRAEAAAALGKIGRSDVVPHLKALLADDPHGQVRLSAAGALYQLGDASGASLLRDLASSEHPQMRRSAAWLLASQPDEAWKALVRSLASDPDPVTRLDAAKLLAEHDPDFSRSLFESLRADTNLAIREETELAVAQSPVSGFPVLRQLLRAGSGLVKVRAAARLLALTR